MARQNGQFTWATPVGTVLGDSTASAAKVRVFTATERVTVVEVGAIAGDSANLPDASFTFRALKRTGGVVANDFVFPVYNASNAAEGGPPGNTPITSSVITNTSADLTGGKALRAYCEITLDKGDQLVFEVVGTTASGTVVFYAKAYADGAGLVETNDVDSN